MHSENEQALSERRRRALWRRERQDAIYHETLHPEQEPEEKIPQKGGVDLPMLLITTALILFGCVMIYSASSVFAVQHHDDNTYFIARHLLFLFLAVVATTIVVAYCTPRFWKDFSYILFGVAIVFLLFTLLRHFL